MLQGAINDLRQQFLGLSRVLSTVTELVNEGLSYDSDEALLEFAAQLLAKNHNVGLCSAYTLGKSELKWICSVAANTMSINKLSDDEHALLKAQSDSLAGELIQTGSDRSLKRESHDTTYYALPLVYRNNVLAIITITPQVPDEGHNNLINIVGSILTSLIVNARQSHDLTEQVRRRTQELENAWLLAQSSSNAKTQFLNNISHEYLTPLNAIVGFSDLLISDTGLSEEQSDYVNSIQNASNDLLKMVVNKLDFSTKDSDKPLSDEVNLREVMRTLDKKYRGQADRKSLAFNLCVPEQIPKSVTVDKIKLEQILASLVSNAIKFSESGSVTVELQCETTEVKANIRFFVTDTGIGIEESEFERIFEIFQQLDDSDRRSYGGTGLGLAISQKLARILGTQIRVTSSLNRGSCFSFELVLPIVKESTAIVPDITLDEIPGPVPECQPGQPQESTQVMPTISQKLNILLVEDNLVNQKLARKLLQKMGCDVDIASDGFSAIDMFQLTPYDMIFMDCQMPNMDGFEATAQIRTLETDTHIPIIALTANSGSEDRARSLQAGMDEFLTKPIAREKLQHALTKWGNA